MTEGGVVWRCKTKYAYGQSVNAPPLGISLTCGTGVWANRSQLIAKWPTRRSLRETRSENTQTGSHGGQDIFEHGWLIDIIHYMLGCRFPPFSGINVYFIRDKKNKSTYAPPCGSSSSTTRTTALGSSPLREVEQWWYSACWVLQCMPLTIWHRMDWCMSTEGRLH